MNQDKLYSEAIKLTRETIDNIIRHEYFLREAPEIRELDSLKMLGISDEKIKYVQENLGSLDEIVYGFTLNNFAELKKDHNLKKLFYKMINNISSCFIHGLISNNLRKNNPSQNLVKNLAQIYTENFEFFKKDFNRNDIPHPFDVNSVDKLAHLFFQSPNKSLIKSLMDLYNSFYDDTLFVNYVYGELGECLRDYKQKFENPQKLQLFLQNSVHIFMKNKDLLKSQVIQIKSFMVRRTISYAIPFKEEEDKNLIAIEYKLLDAFAKSKYQNMDFDLERIEKDHFFRLFLKEYYPDHKFCYFNIILSTKKSFGSQDSLKKYKAINLLKKGDCDSIEEIIELCNLNIPGYSLSKRLGVGTYKKVYLGRNIISNALKAISIFDVSERGKTNIGKRGISLLDMIKNETEKAENLKNMDNPHILKIDDIIYDKESENYVLITELIDKTLQQELDRMGCKLSEKFFWQYLPQIMDGLEIIHQKGMTHSDLTLHNIGIKGETLKLMDFGLTSYISGFDEKGINTGSIDTRAPELFEGKRATTQSDMWSLGCIMYKLLTGEDLFSPNIKKPQEPSVERDNYEMDVYKLINSKNINKELKNLKSSDQIKNILKKCLERNPSKRVKNASELRVMLDLK